MPSGGGVSLVNREFSESIDVGRLESDEPESFVFETLNGVSAEATVIAWQIQSALGFATSQKYIGEDEGLEWLAVDLAQHFGNEALTRREIELLQELAQGKSNKVIAYHLAVSEDTVKSHMRNILVKLSANDRTNAVTIAVRRGCFDLLDSAPRNVVVGKDHPI